MSHDTSTPVAKRGQQNAVALARQRLIEVRESVGTAHADYASALIQLALLLIMHGDPTEAEPLLRQALEIRRATLGERHPDYATCLSSLAGLLWARGDLDAAEPLLRQALEIRCEVLGERHPKSVVSQNSLDQLLQAKKAWDSAANLDTTEVVVPPAAPQAVAAPEADAAPVAPEPAPEPEAAAAPESASIAEINAQFQPEPVAEAHDEREPAPVAEAHAEPESEPVAAPEAAPQPETFPTPEPAPVPEPVTTAAPVAPEPVAAVAARSRDELLLAIEELAGRFADLGGELHGAVGRLKEQGVLPADSLIDALHENRNHFASLRHDTVQLAQSLGMTDAETRPTGSLDDLGALLGELERYELERSRSGQARRQALDTLARIAGLAYADRRDFAPLHECQDAARSLEQTIADAHPSELPSEAFTIADGSHAYNALLALADPEAGLNDEEWANALELVQNQFGKPLSVAAARAKIVTGAAN